MGAGTQAMVSMTNPLFRLEAKVEIWKFDDSLDVKRLENWLRLMSRVMDL